MIHTKWYTSFSYFTLHKSASVKFLLYLGADFEGNKNEIVNML
jgi:hypothetical protein